MIWLLEFTDLEIWILAHQKRKIFEVRGWSVLFILNYQIWYDVAIADCDACHDGKDDKNKLFDINLRVQWKYNWIHTYYIQLNIVYTILMLINLRRPIVNY